ncbi:MAG TPA: EndoU domain-containing protein [Candidatus Babeliales bacterium]|nr:EndoU domain-containing protein [Candidatus Babeliales bacterium]
MRLNKASKCFLIFLLCALIPSGNNHSMHLVAAEEALLVLEEIGLCTSVTLGAWLSMYRQPEVYDPSKARLYTIPSPVDRDVQRIVYDVNRQEVLKSYKHIAEQYHKPAYRLPTLDKKSAITAADKVFGPMFDGRADAKTAAARAKIIIAAAKNSEIYSEVFSKFAENKVARCAAKFARLQQAHFTDQFDKIIQQEAIQKNQLNAAFRGLRAVAAKSIIDAAGVKEEGVAHIELARQKLESIRELYLYLPKVFIKGYELDAQTFLLEYDQMIARYSDPVFTMVMQELFGDVVATIGTECFDGTGTLKCSEDKNIVLAKCLYHMAEHKDQFEFLFKGQTWSKFKNQNFDYHSLARLASEESGIDLYILNNLYDNKLLYLSSPQISDEHIERIKTNPANCQMRNLKYALDQCQLLDAKKMCDVYREECQQNDPVSYGLYHMAHSAYNVKISELMRVHGIAPYIDNPLWRSCTSGEQLTILQDYKLAQSMGQSLRVQHEALMKDIPSFYKFPSAANITKSERDIFKKLTTELLYKTPKQRTDRLLEAFHSKSDEDICIKKYLFMPNGILRSHSNSYIARHFKLDPAKSAHAYQFVNSFNHLLSFDSEQAEVKQLVDIGTAALVHANYTTGYEFFDWLELATSVEKCLDGNPYYQPLKDIKLEQGKLQESIGLMHQCAREERFSLKRVSLDNDAIRQMDAETSKQVINLLARDYHLESVDHNQFLSLLALHPQAHHAALVQSVFNEYHSGQASPKIVALYHALYSENNILRAFEDYEWVKRFKLNSKQSAKFQQQTTDLANQLLIRFRDTSVVRDLAKLEQVAENTSQIDALVKEVDEGLECVAMANSMPDEALYFHSLASYKLQEIDKTIIGLYPEHTEYLYPQTSGQSDFLNTYEIGTEYTTFKCALDTLHIHFNPTGFKESEVSAADKVYADIFGRGIFWKPLCDDRKYSYTNIELNTQLHPHVQEAIVLTGSRLLAVRTDVENAQHVNRALRYVERANAASSDDAEVYLETAQAIYKGLTVTDAYKEFLDVDFLSEDAALESHRQSLDQCSKEEERQLRFAMLGIDSPLRGKFKATDTNGKSIGSGKYLPGVGGKPIKLPGGIVISPPKGDSIDKLPGLYPPHEDKPEVAEPGTDIKPDKVAKPRIQPGKVKKPRLEVEEGEEEIYDADKENVNPGVNKPKTKPEEVVEPETKPSECEEEKVKAPEVAKPEERVKGVVKSPNFGVAPATYEQKTQLVDPPAPEPQKPLQQLDLEYAGVATQWDHKTQVVAERMSNAFEKELKRLDIKVRKTRITYKDIEHVERGEYSVKRGKFEGGHISPVHNGKFIKILNINPIGDQGVYGGKPDHFDFHKPEPKTFFPKEWPVNKVMNEMIKIMEKRNMEELDKKNPVVDRFLIVLENGIKVELITSPNGITFFPQYKQ